MLTDKIYYYFRIVYPSLLIYFSLYIIHNKTEIVENYSTRMGFEPTRAEHIGLAVQRLNHSATSSFDILDCSPRHLTKKLNIFKLPWITQSHLGAIMK